MKLRTLSTIILMLVATSVWAQEEKLEKKSKQAPAKRAAEARQLSEGDKAPNFELESLDGKKVKLSDRFEGDDASPVVLLFSRAHW